MSASATYDLLEQSFGKYTHAFLGFSVLVEYESKINSKSEALICLNNLTPNQKDRLERLLAVIDGYRKAQDHFRYYAQKQVDPEDTHELTLKKFSQSCLDHITPHETRLPVMHLMGTWRLFDMGSPLVKIREDACISSSEYCQKVCSEVIGVTSEPMGWW